MLRKLILCAVGILACTALAYADTVTSGPFQVNVAKQLNARGETPAFFVDSTGAIKVEVESRTSSLLPIDPVIRVRIDLLRPDGSKARTQEVLINFNSKKTTLNYTVTANDISGASKLWKVRITNIDTSNRMASEHKVKLHFPSATRTLPVAPSTPLTLFSGQSADRTFKLNPNRNGKLQITATWNTDLLGGGILNPVSMKVSLFRQGPNGTKVQVATKTMKSPMSFTYQVQTADLANGSTWTMVILNPNSEGIEHFVPKVRFTPAPQ